MTPSPLSQRPARRTGSRGERGWGMVAAVLLLLMFSVKVVVAYYFWNWIGSKFDWPHVGFWWFIPITAVLLVLEIPMSYVVLRLFGRDD